MIHLMYLSKSVRDLTVFHRNPAIIFTLLVQALSLYFGSTVSEEIQSVAVLLYMSFSGGARMEEAEVKTFEGIHIMLIWFVDARFLFRTTIKCPG